jgi:hypothetical protein
MEIFGRSPSGSAGLSIMIGASLGEIDGRAVRDQLLFNPKFTVYRLFPELWQMESAKAKISHAGADDRKCVNWSNVPSDIV